MEDVPADTFDNEWLQAVHEARALFVIAFVLANALAIQLQAWGFVTVANLLILVATLPLFVVVAGLLRETYSWFGGGLST